MKVIFLDFDGVLNSTPFLRSQSKAKIYTDIGALDPTAVNRVNRIVAETGAKIVVSSSWRHGKDAASLMNLLAKVGFIGEIVGLTPDILLDVGPGYKLRIRGDEIQAWLDANPCERFVILDDNDDMGHLSPYLVQTSAKLGITDADVDRAIGVLT